MKNDGPFFDWTPSSHQRGLIALVTLILASAALLKAERLLFGLAWHSHFENITTLSIILFELLLALCFPLRTTMKAAWHVAIAFFFTGVIFNLNLALSGASDCGCFGRFFATPRAIATVDALLVTALLAFRPPFSVAEGQILLRSLRSPTVFACGAVIGIAFVASYGMNRFFSDGINVKPLATSLGQVRLGEERTFACVLSNSSDRPITILGARSSCSCISLTGLPADVLPGKSCKVNASIKVPTIGRFEGTIAFIINDKNSHRRLVRYHGKGVK